MGVGLGVNVGLGVFDGDTIVGVGEPVGGMILCVVGVAVQPRRIRKTRMLITKRVNLNARRGRKVVEIILWALRSLVVVMWLRIWEEGNGVSFKI